ncbi:unnamed protein product [Phytomonas sp. Hart1]|nr:unnamed protein product [Phytomonas sp. Hart1]|eukprot:CCW70349.1 unnamed protein product [Phytomonas sp. isolate Hart1]
MRHGFFDSFAKLSKGTGGGQTEKGETHRSDRTSSIPNDGFPPGLSAENLRSIKELFNKQTPEKQKQLMEQALEFQKKMGKIPGFRKISEQGVQTMEAFLKQQSVGGSGSPSPGGIFPSEEVNSVQGQFSNQRHGTIMKSSPAVISGNGGLTLDELKKVNLGPEIEALFEELRSIREKKNHYRELYNKTKAMLETESKEKNELASSLNRVHGRLKRAEHEVLLLNSECMDSKQVASQVKSLIAQNRRLSDELNERKAAVASSADPSHADLQRRLKAKEAALHSLQRKVERMRRRDPILGFSILCSDVARFCDTARDPLKGLADEAFEVLQTNYLRQQQAVWAAAAGNDNGAAAKAFVAVVKRFFSSRLPHYNYDAMMTVEGDVQALKDIVNGLGFLISPVAGKDGRWMLASQADATPLTTSLGPYAYAFTLWYLSTTRISNSSSSNNNDSNPNRNPKDSDYTSSTNGLVSLPFAALPYTVTHVVPYVSSTLVENQNRISIEYETARSSGPGGQATNTTETQIHGKLFIDGATAFSAQAQDSRSALQNKESATAKLMAKRRQQYNENLSKQHHAEEMEKNMLTVMSAVSIGTFATAAVEIFATESVQRAAEAEFIPKAEIALVRCFLLLKKKLKGNKASG